MLSGTVDRAKITVYSNVLKQINAKVKQDLYSEKAATFFSLGGDEVAADINH